MVSNAKFKKKDYHHPLRLRHRGYSNLERGRHGWCQMRLHPFAYKLYGKNFSPKMCTIESISRTNVIV